MELPEQKCEDMKPMNGFKELQTLCMAEAVCAWEIDGNDTGKVICNQHQVMSEIIKELVYIKYASRFPLPSRSLVWRVIPEKENLRTVII